MWLLCTACRKTWYTAAALTFLRRRTPCTECGGALAKRPAPAPQR